MRPSAAFLVLPLFVLSCGRDALELDSTSRGLEGGDLSEPEPQDEGPSKSNDSEEVPLIDEPTEVETPDDEVIPPDASPPPGPTLAGRDACRVFGGADQVTPRFVAAEWQYQVKDCLSSACWDFFTMNAACKLTFQHDNNSRMATAPSDVCHAATGVFTSARFVAATKACPMVNQPINESFSLEGELRVHRKFSFCNSADMENARACLRWVVKSTFDSDK